MGQEDAESRSRTKGPVLYRTCPQCGGKVPAEKKRCPGCGVNLVVARQNRTATLEGEADGFGPERAALRKGVVGGIALVLVAVVWFVLGLQAGYIFYYPPILALVGIFGIVKGLTEGNIAGRPTVESSRRRRRTARSRPAAAAGRRASERAPGGQRPLPELTAASKNDRHRQREEVRQRGRRKMTIIVLGTAVLAVGVAGLLSHVAEKEAREARERLAARLQAEHERLVAARGQLAARVQLLEGIDEVISRASPSLRPQRVRVEPEPRYSRSDQRNILFAWLARENVEQPGIPDDRMLVEELAARATRSSPPEKPWRGSLDADLRQVLSRHIVVAEVLGHTPPRSLSMSERLRAIRSRDLGSLNSFEGGAWQVAVHLIDSQTKNVVASDGFEVESSEEIEITMTIDPHGPIDGEGADIDRAAAIDLDRQLADALAWRLQRLAGGTWSFQAMSR